MPRMVSVLICGDRNWLDKETISYYLSRTLPSMGLSPTRVIEGGARGADTLGKEAAQGIGIPVTEVSAEWERYGRAAGMLRNQTMIEMCPDVVLAFHDHLDESKGTKDMLNRARRYGKAIILTVNHNGQHFAL